MLNIDLRFSDSDIEGLVRAHKYWDFYLRSLGIGKLQYLEADLHCAVKRQFKVEVFTKLVPLECRLIQREELSTRTLQSTE